MEKRLEKQFLDFEYPPYDTTIRSKCTITFPGSAGQTGVTSDVKPGSEGGLARKVFLTDEKAGYGDSGEVDLAHNPYHVINVIRKRYPRLIATSTSLTGNLHKPLLYNGTPVAHAAELHPEEGFTYLRGRFYDLEISTYEEIQSEPIYHTLSPAGILRIDTRSGCSELTPLTAFLEEAEKFFALRRKGVLFGRFREVKCLYVWNMVVRRTKWLRLRKTLEKSGLGERLWAKFSGEGVEEECSDGGNP